MYVYPSQFCVYSLLFHGDIVIWHAFLYRVRVLFEVQFLLQFANCGFHVISVFLNLILVPSSVVFVTVMPTE